MARSSIMGGERAPQQADGRSVDALGPMFLSAEDFDATGILAGVEPSASNYWWIPELHRGVPDLLTVDVELTDPRFENGPGQRVVTDHSPVPARHHAAWRTSRRSTAA